MYNRRFWFIGSFLTSLLAQVLVAQTTQWRLIWDANTEDDMAYYRVFRGNSAQADSLIGTVTHPNTVYVDNKIQPGVLYYYRLKAVDQTELESDFSEVVSAAIPRISSIKNQTINQGGNFEVINLDNHISDPDHAASRIIWTSTGNSQLTVNIDDQRRATITASNPNWYGSENILFIATDPDSFFDQQTVTFKVNATPQINRNAIANQGINQGESFEPFDLDDIVTDPDNDDSELQWSVSGAASLHVNIDNHNVVTISPMNPEWYGSETIIFTVTDPGGLSANSSATFKINAPPKIIAGAITDQEIGQGQTFADIALNTCVDDPDNPYQELNWSYYGNNRLTVTVNTASIASITIPTDWSGQERITFKVTDPGGLSDSVSATFTVLPPGAMQLANIPGQVIAEGENFNSINLNEYLIDSGDGTNEAQWRSEQRYLIVSIDGHQVANLSRPFPSWVGTDTVRFIAQNSQGNTASKQALFTVNAQPQLSGIPGEMISYGQNFSPIRLDDYVTDRNDPKENLTWQISGSSQLIVQINSARLATISLPDPQWTGSEMLIFTVTDPFGASASDHAVFTRLRESEGTVTALGLNGQTIDQGEEFDPIQLDGLVSCDKSLKPRLNWSCAGNQYLSVEIDSLKRIAHIKPLNPDWFGSEELTFKVTTPSGYALEMSALFRINRTIFLTIDYRFLGSGTIIQIQWQTTIALQSAIEYKAGSLTNQTLHSDQFNTKHSFTIAGLKPKTSYRFQATGTDSSGNEYRAKEIEIVTGDAGEINVFPNPYRAGEFPENDVISFVNLPIGSEIIIYNLLGEPVFRQAGIDFIYRWNTGNDHNRPVQSGLYMYLVKDADNKKLTSGKLVIIR